ncbi:MAG TPA: SRPBCC family protein [Aliidongia sp.]|nr:SRPBCC family protein [Aliidongia sp.]
MRAVLAGLALLCAAQPAAAAVKSAAPQGFEVVETATIRAAPHEAYAALLAIGKWWDGEHTFSHSAANLEIAATVGGCWCEHLKDGGMAQHMTVTMVMPDRLIEFHGALGPLRFEGVDGSMSWALKPAEGGGTLVTLNYVVGGYFRAGGEHWAPLVDKVLGEQLARYGRLVETGSPSSG